MPQNLVHSHQPGKRPLPVSPISSLCDLLLMPSVGTSRHFWICIYSTLLCSNCSAVGNSILWAGKFHHFCTKSEGSSVSSGMSISSSLRMALSPAHQLSNTLSDYQDSSRLCSICKWSTVVSCQMYKLNPVPLTCRHNSGDLFGVYGYD